MASPAFRNLRAFAMFQRSAWRALFRRRSPVVELPAAPEGPSHPSQLCRCLDGRPASIMSDHDGDCPWLAAMCRTCSGTGYCSACGGDGTNANEHLLAAQLVDGELGPEDAERARAHLAVCERCAQELHTAMQLHAVASTAREAKP